MWATLGWLMAEAAFASRTNRSRRSGSSASSAGRILNGDAAVELRVLRQINLAHRAFAQLLEDAVVGELLRNHRALSYMQEAELREQRDSPSREIKIVLQTFGFHSHRPYSSYIRLRLSVAFKKFIHVTALDLLCRWPVNEPGRSRGACKAD